MSGGIGPTTIIVPSGMVARIERGAGLRSVSVHGNYERNGKLYVSPEYSTAEHRVDLRVEAGIGSVTTRQSGDE